MFVTTCREDYKLFLEHTDRLKLRINVTVPKNNYENETCQRPLSQDQIQQLGFEGFAIDFLEGPENLLKYICISSFLHCVVSSVRR
jgi:hypothetical protein